MAPKTKFVPNYEIAVGLHKGHKVTKYNPDKVKPSRQSRVIIKLKIFFFWNKPFIAALNSFTYNSKTNMVNLYAIWFVKYLACNHTKRELSSCSKSVKIKEH